MRREIDAGSFTVNAPGMLQIEVIRVPLVKNEHSNEPQKNVGKKPYHTPAFRFEQVFEVSALSCGKVSSTQGACHSTPKAS